ncbi:transglycosylase SLT domain-containing protein, partial [bacterium]|nr:transglycosylase SLT domain-containing protein [bacterium]
AYYTQGQGLISQRRNNASYFYHYDGLGSTKALTDVNQNIQSSYKYDAWGNILQSSGTITNLYLSVGELGYYRNGDSGMYLLTQRLYNSVIGRFTSPGPVFAVKDFLYCEDDPVNEIDPLGLVSNKPKPKPTPTIPEPSKDWKDCAEKVLAKFCKGMRLTDYELVGKNVDIDWKVIRYIIWAESRDNPNAENSESLARGLMQITLVQKEGLKAFDKYIHIIHIYKP